MTIDPVIGISDWLSLQGIDGYAAVFAEHDIDMETLPELTYDHLREMGLPIGACH